MMGKVPRQAFLSIICYLNPHKMGIILSIPYTESQEELSHMTIGTGARNQIHIYLLILLYPTVLCHKIQHHNMEWI